ncbi:MAG: hypothetical protein ACRCYU_23045 [Nocardioides sp.]
MSAEGPPEVDDRPAEDEVARFFSADHPTFTPIMGFFTGLLFVSLVPAGFLSVLHQLFAPAVARGLSPLMAITLVVPLALLVWRRSRRFGRYMVLGMVVTMVVVIGVTTLVVWLMARRDL